MCRTVGVQSFSGHLDETVIWRPQWIRCPLATKHLANEHTMMTPLSFATNWNDMAGAELFVKRRKVTELIDSIDYREAWRSQIRIRANWSLQACA